MFKDFLLQENITGYRAKQFWQQYLLQGATSAAEITTWPKELREKLAQQGEFLPLKEKQVFTAKDGNTVKVLFERPDGLVIESVLMRHRDGRNTICVSSMVGCPVGCVFCATGKMGFLANLTAEEIVEQVIYFARILRKENEKVTNVVFMGMGEPLLNYEPVLEAVKILTDPDFLGLSDRRISISTSGYPKQIIKLVESGYKGKLAISLHAPNQELRASLMPVAVANPLPELMASLDRFVELTNKRVFYEYLLLDGVNDTVEHAAELALLLRGRLAHVNLIPFNPIPGTALTKSSRTKVQAFLDELEAQGITATIRVPFGVEIAGACGQLATKISANS